MPKHPCHCRTLQDTAFPEAFKLAHKIDPTAKLCINDLSLIEAHNAPKLVRIIKEHVWAHGAPIHCIGIQVRSLKARPQC
jgi:GH35 family endo-1,4-beta-xylanase